VRQRPGRVGDHGLGQPGVGRVRPPAVRVGHSPAEISGRSCPPGWACRARRAPASPSMTPSPGPRPARRPRGRPPPGDTRPGFLAPRREPHDLAAAARRVGPVTAYPSRSSSPADRLTASRTPRPGRPRPAAGPRRAEHPQHVGADREASAASRSNSARKLISARDSRWQVGAGHAVVPARRRAGPGLARAGWTPETAGTPALVPGRASQAHSPGELADHGRTEPFPLTPRSRGQRPEIPGPAAPPVGRHASRRDGAVGVAGPTLT